MKRQEYWCEICGVESHVLHRHDAGVMEVVHLLDDDHKKWSPECDTPATKLRVWNTDWLTDNGYEI
ncbi:hypothetical protein LCGC14_3062360 [marine sediment metagenome]|uniref:Uncharacterized protein n=1 Tax=marine sediment metagenome TaxID=412755 RepID=A0A0F8WJ15_9ZZZZ